MQKHGAPEGECMILPDWWGVACARVKRTGSKKEGWRREEGSQDCREVSAEDEDERKRQERTRRGEGGGGSTRKGMTMEGRGNREGGGGEGGGGEDPARSRYDPAERGRISRRGPLPLV